MTTGPSPALPRAGPLRSPLRVWALSALTLGLYGVVHHYAVNRELRDFGVDVRPVLSVLALVPGVVAVAPPFVTLWRTTDRIGVAQETAGLTPSVSGPLGASALFLWLFAPYHQRELNKVWRADRAGSPTPTRATWTRR